MPLFIYIAKNQKNESITGKQEAINQHELAGYLRQQGLILISCELNEIKEGILKRAEALINPLRRIPLVEKMMFSRHLSIMIKAGLSLSQALSVLSEQITNSKFKKIVSNVEQSVKQGKSFSESLSRYPKVFNELYISMVQVGEIGGTLENVLKILAEQMKKNHELISRVRGALIYPAVIVATMVGIGILMMIKVVPKLTETFIELNVQLPLSTRMIIFISDFLRNNIFLCLIMFIFLIIALRFLLKYKIVKKYMDSLWLKLPIFGSMIRKINSARFSRTFSSLLSSGVPAVKSLQIISNTMGNTYFKESLNASAEKIQKGEEMSVALSNYKKLYPPMVVQMIKVGEETGSLPEILEHLAVFYEEEVDNITKNLTAIIEPIVMIIIGAVVGFFAISMIQPMYSMMNAL